MKVLFLNLTQHIFEKYLLSGVNKELLLQKYRYNFKGINYNELLSISFIQNIDSINENTNIEDCILDVISFKNFGPRNNEIDILTSINLEDYSLIVCMYEKYLDLIKKKYLESLTI